MNNASVIPLIAELRESKPISEERLENYRAAYSAAEKGISLAENVKYGSVYVAGVLVIATLLMHGSLRSERYGFPIVSVSIIAGGVFLLLAAQFWSMMFRTQNRLLQMAIEVATNTSPFLTNPQRLQIISPINAPSPAKREKKMAA